MTLTEISVNQKRVHVCDTHGDQCQSEEGACM